MEKTTQLKVQNIEGGTIFSVKVVPGSSRNCISGIYDGMVKIKIACPPEKGKANRSLTAFLANLLDVNKNQISIISGLTNRVKQIRVSGICSTTLSDKLISDK